ncbi:MAG: hypothetical protein GX604_06680 [Actinobacteria bacterium]|nr:hypothetical protein [Actinomycetota bacterium]
MAWPAPEDYYEAIQNPKFAFADKELQQGHPELTSYGLPRPISGNFASVYRMQCGQRDWAVKCFLREFKDQQQRYEAIDEHLARVQLPYTVGCTFLHQGIKVRGQWYPILKMEWVKGQPLNVYIEKHLASPDTLLSLASRWVQMVKALRQASVAHGDLQHGNVLVVQGDLRLVDYDGMYVPALSGKASHEIGHPHYQHPRRTESDFGPDLDNFSAWVIYMSLIALTVDPRLWQQFGGDESLLFRKQDFERPQDSRIIHALDISPDERIRSASAFFKSFLDLGLQQTPSLDGQIRLPLPPPKGLSVPGSSWLDDHLESRRPAAPTEHLPEDPVGGGQDSSSSGDPSWILDFLAPDIGAEAKVAFQNSALPERLILATSTIAALLLTFATSTLGVGMALPVLALPILLAAMVNAIFWVRRYRSEPGVADLASLTSELRMISDEIDARVRDIEAVDQQKTHHMNRYAGERARIAKAQKAVEANEKEAKDASQRALRVVLSSTNRRRQVLRRQEAEALQKIQGEIGVKVADLSRRIDALTQTEVSELVNTLRAQQEQYMTTYLRRFTVEDASVLTIGPVLKWRLMWAGFRTAADIDVHRVQSVQGIGWSRAASLGAWRASIESMARSGMPKSLSRTTTAFIQAKYRTQRRALEDERDREQQRQSVAETSVRSQCRSSLAWLEREEIAARTKTAGEIDEIRARYAQQYRSFQDYLLKLAADSAPRLREIDGMIAEARKELFRLRWEREKLRRQLKVFEEIRFRKYVKRVFFGSGAT